MREQRGEIDNSESAKQRKTVIHAGMWLFIGWLLHYVPFWAMHRVLYYHHYFPALLYNSMLTGIIFNYIMEKIHRLFPGKTGNTIYHAIYGLTLSVLVYRYDKKETENNFYKQYYVRKLIFFVFFSFYEFSPLTYGMDGPPAMDPKSPLHHLRWLETWEF